jgi:protein-L-isoaspartate(D-aspartate) O-methyltransferase
LNRADFIPEVIWVRRDGWFVPVRRTEDPERWLALVNADDAVVTQVDDGKPREGGRGIIATSSSSAPGVMKLMLGMLDVGSGLDVLEIGTGTGYNAAIIAERVMPGRVTSVEVDEPIAERAREALTKVGSSATVITGDGADGYAPHAPYDRVMSTASLRTVPYTWVEQTRPGGRMVFPMVAGFYERQAFIGLDVHDDRTATGMFRSGAAFMRLRGERDDPVVWWDHEDDRRVSTTRINPRAAFEDYEAGFALGLLCSGMVAGSPRTDDGTEVLRLSHFASDSWASFRAADTNGEYEVVQCGPRSLWDELEAAYLWWVGVGRPEHTRFGLTVAEEGQHVWLDSPDQVIETPLG